MALALGAAGANNALVARNVALLNGVKEAVENAGGRGQFFQVDVLEDEQIRKLERDVIAAFGGVHVRRGQPAPVGSESGLKVRKDLTQHFCSLRLP
jgi:NAD(P)-dependent dehydrogenase (short-subunit alcohol dehydrogenase family)